MKIKKENGQVKMSHPMNTKAVLFTCSFLMFLFICISQTDCNHSTEPDQQQEKPVFTEDLYDRAIDLYADSAKWDESLSAFASVLKEDCCSCFWDSYLYIANIYIMRGQADIATEILNLGYYSIASLPDSINHIKEKRLQTILNMQQQVHNNPPFIFKPDTGITFTPYDEPPHLIGGFSALQNELNYPQDAYDQGIEGRAVVWARISWEGEVCKSRIQKGLGSQSIDDECRRVIRAVKWIPAYSGDKVVEVWIAIPIDFQIR